MNVQWFPGHMAKARRMITETAAMADGVCEIVDARIPVSSRNPEIGDLCGHKPRLIVLNRADQADEAQTAAWARRLEAEGNAVLLTDAKSGKGTNGFQAAVRRLLKEKTEYYAQRGQTGRLLRIMVLGIPNVGKSSFINRVAGRRAAEASDRPGVTRGKQWINIGGGIELLDTPGLLWPKFEDKTVGEYLAFTGAVRDEILDTETLGMRLMELLRDAYPAALTARYKIDPAGQGGYELLQAAARKRGFLISGGETDTERMANVLLDEFRGGKLGRLTLERCVEE
ncbi:MAG: ribosome biogenesis GTPase YlqF [Oscillospiraceae bacterium]|nr:ribosome biogenesis GTPase YlqF [Oscillospiraceae bacterium]